MKLIFAPDSFKGSMSGKRAAELLTLAAQKVFGDCECVSLPAADGGEGTVDAVISAVGGKKADAAVHDPLMNKISAAYGIFEDKAVIEAAAASGLTLVPGRLRNPLNTTSYSTGELIADALKRGCREIAVAIGGSATNDGGMGCARALGVRFLDKNGAELSGCGRDLISVDRIDLSGVDPGLAKTKLTVLCDVKNPLCGKNGATLTFSKQKGATPEIRDELERGMCSYREVIKKQCGADCDRIEGAGAAGGLGAALKVFFGAEMRSGIETVLDLINFDRHLQNADLVVTGEGRTDSQSCCGKVMQGVGLRAKKYGVPAVGLSGSLGDGAEGLFSYGICSLMTGVDRPMELDEAMENAEPLYLNAAERMFRFIKTGMEMRG